jgi:membrane protease YdiL (CAAX protease family)
VWLSRGGAPPDLRELGTISFLPYLGGGAWLLWILTNGFGEEIGWRGFALPRLQQRHSALTATLILGSLWAFWHLPFLFYLPNFRAMGLVGFPGLALGILCGAIVLTWLYNGTNGSVLAASLWHGAFNFVTASAAGQGTVAMIMSIVVMVWAILIVVVFKPASLSRAPKQTGI